MSGSIVTTIMGQTESIPGRGSYIGYVAICLRKPNKVTLLYAPNDVIALIQDILGSHGPRRVGKNKFGAVQYNLPGRRPFMASQGKNDSTLGKLFVLQVLEGMYQLGYDFVVSSDLARMHDQSTMFFKKVCSRRNIDEEDCKLTCIAPGGFDKLTLLRHDDNVEDCVAECILTCWPSGIKKMEKFASLNEDVCKIKIKGNPWMASDKEATDTKRLLDTIVMRMSRIGWRFYANVNIKSCADAMFFMKTPHDTLATSVISFNRTDRVRLIGSMSKNQDVVRAVRKCIDDNWQKGTKLEESNHPGEHEYKLTGHPFLSNGLEAVKSRRLICRLFETCRLFGWAPHTGMDTTKKFRDKSIVVMIRCKPRPVQFGCVALSDAQGVRFIGFPRDVLNWFQPVVRHSYAIGIEEEHPRAEKCFEFKLKGKPWNGLLSHGLHGRAMLVHILKTANDNGWRLMASLDTTSSVDISGRNANRIMNINRLDATNQKTNQDVHSWYFSNDLGEEDGSIESGTLAPPPNPDFMRNTYEKADML